MFWFCCTQVLVVLLVCDISKSQKAFKRDLLLFHHCLLGRSWMHDLRMVVVTVCLYGRNTFALSFLVAVWVLLIVVLLACLYRNGRLSIEEGRI